MTIPPGGPSTHDGPPAQSPVLSDPRADQPLSHQGMADVPALADSVQLIGQMEGSGYRKPPSLVRRSDGQTLQLTPLLYHVLEAVDGQRTHDEIAAHASAAAGRLVTAENVRTLIDSQLRPLGLLTRADGTQPELKKANPLLSMRFRYAVTDPERTRRLTAPFAVLFHPLVVIPVVVVFLAVSAWLLFNKGLASATVQAFDQPGLLLAIFAVTLVSAGFHEFGHAAAARYGGATPGVMGAGVYLVWPAFYTDVTDSYRLGRAGRVRTDLGGLYFNAITAVGIAGLWWATRYDALLLIVAAQLLQMIRQLAPLVRFDGYHLLADITGVPDLFQRIKPTLLGLLPWKWNNPENAVLKPWARAVVTLWVLTVVPLLLFTMVMLVLALPRVLATAWESTLEQQEMLTTAWNSGDALGAAARILALLAIALPMLGILYLLVRLVRQLATAAWRGTEGRPVRRALAGATAAAVVLGLAWAWWPNSETYRPIQAYERGTVMDAAAAVTPQRTGLSEGGSGQTVALWPDDSELPTREKPQLAMVLVPRADPDAAPATDGTSSGEASGDSESDATAPAPSWVFPFNKPLPPEEGDNQALAVNTEDGSVVYDVAFALVWAEGDQVLNANEAYAFASCDGCAAVAVGFQVVLIIGQADVIVPQNLAAAVNYNCVDCLTYALASQLVITLDGPLSDAGMDELRRLWEEIARYGANLENVPLSEIQAQLETYKAQIVAIIEADESATGGDGNSEESPTGEPSEAPASEPGADPDTSAPPSDPALEPAPEPAPSDPALEPAPEPAPSDPALEPAPEPTAPPATEEPLLEPAPSEPAPVPSA